MRWPNPPHHPPVSKALASLPTGERAECWDELLRSANPAGRAWRVLHTTLAAVRDAPHPIPARPFPMYAPVPYRPTGRVRARVAVAG